jgi:hypothetical protein
MNIESRKLEFIQEFLKLQSEDTILLFEKLLQKEKQSKSQKVLKPMTASELDTRIDQSEADFRNHKFKTSDELLAKYK